MITKAAMKYYIFPLEKEVIIPVHRHGDGEVILKRFEFKPVDYRLIEQGFLTDEDEFLGRSDALEHAYESGQLRKYDPWELKSILDSDVLMSEDLW